MKSFLLIAALVLATAPAQAGAKKSSRQSGVLKSDTASARSESSGLGSDSPSSFLGSTEFNVMSGAAFISNFTGALIDVKGAYKLLPRAPLYGEAGVSTAFNGSRAVFPLDAGGRFDFNLRNAPAAKPFAHLSLGPAFATSGSNVVIFHLYSGAGLMYHVAHNMDARFDMGAVLFSDNIGFQFRAGVAL